MKLGTNDISKIYLGTAEISNIYLGTSQVYESGDTPTPPTPVPYSGQYLTFESLEDGNSISFSRNSISYSTDNGTTWNTLTTGNSISLDSGETVMFKASGLGINNGIGTFSSTKTYNVYGNIMSLVSGDSFANATTVEDYHFLELFNNCSGLTSVENLVLPATTLADYSYEGMFYNCSSLTTAPALPATTLGQYCYGQMFYNCTSLTVAPELPATTLAEECYYSMFAGCTSLTAAPVLSATTMENWCYGAMFADCTSLTVAPVLPATMLTSDCYTSMFQGCTSLSSITCYAVSMIDDDLMEHATDQWVDGVASSGTFNKAANMCDWATGDSGIPDNWTVVPDDCGA